MELSQFKSLFISQMKSLYSEKVIYPEHSLINQLNAGIAGGNVLMKLYIDGKRSDISEIETQINGLVSTAILDNFPLSGTDADRKAYVEGYLSSCNTDERKLMCLLALQDIKIIRGD